LPIRSATTAFSLVVVTNMRYFSRLSKKRNGSLPPCGESPPVSTGAPVSVVVISTHGALGRTANLRRRAGAAGPFAEHERGAVI
jgi:hypothetical protein